jgi:hypothetical protein
MTFRHLSAVSAEDAYGVPWVCIHGSSAGAFTLRNVGLEPVSGVTVTVTGRGLMPTSAPATIVPGDALSVRIVGTHLERDTVAVVRWFRPDGREYLWRVSF